MNNNKKATQDRPLTVLIDDSLSCVGRYFSVSEIIIVAQIWLNGNWRAKIKTSRQISCQNHLLAYIPVDRLCLSRCCSPCSLSDFFLRYLYRKPSKSKQVSCDLRVCNISLFVRYWFDKGEALLQAFSARDAFLSTGSLQFKFSAGSFADREHVLFSFKWRSLSSHMIRRTWEWRC